MLMSKGTETKEAEVMKNDAGTVGSAPEEDIDAVVDAVMKKYDRESNTRVWEGKPKLIVSIVLALFSVFCIYVTLFASWLEEIRLSSFVGLIVLIGYIVFPAKKGVQKVNHMPWYDIVIMIAGTASFFYFTFNAYGIIQQGAKFETYQILIGLVGIAALAELCRRSVGLPILIVAAAFIVYALIWGLVNPTFMGRLNYLVRSLFYSKEGILSTPINTCSKFMVVFIIFGAFLERTGIADFFIQAANAVVGGFSGGPAKVAVVASALEGMVSGSSVANTVGSGSVTIPLMKRTGYKPEFAAAAEASASTGGQIMPPIMGAAAFLMADYVAKPYSEIIVMAILPAILYFTGIFISVHLEAKKLGLRGVPRSELPRFGQLAKKLYLLLPLVILIYLVSSNTKTIQTAAAIAIVAAVIVSLFNKGNRITPKRFLEALAAGGQGTISVAAACGIAGIIAGTITMTGLANVIINGIVTLAGDQVIIALFLTMICCIVLGMGVPTTANYCIMAATCAPILVRMGVPLVAAHFFVFYFGIVADLTPPVNPVMLFIDVTGPMQVVSIIITSLVGIFGVASALEGYIFVKMNPVQRVMAAAGGLLLIDPRVLTDIIGIALVAVVIGWQVFTKKRGTVVKAAACAK